MRSHAKTQRRKDAKGPARRTSPAGSASSPVTRRSVWKPRQNYGAGYLFLSLKSFASWRLQRSGREITDRRQNYGAGYLFLSVKSFASWRLERSGREITDRKLLSDAEGKGRMRSHAKMQRGEEDWDGGKLWGRLFISRRRHPSRTNWKPWGWAHAY